MKEVMRQLAQAKRHYSNAPLFEFLRAESISPRDRLLAHRTVPHLHTARMKG